MIKFCSLYSGSSGNAIFISNERARILIDAGLSGKRIAEALISIGEDPAGLSAILVTHEHNDHIKGVGVISKRYDIPIYANELTWQYLQSNITNISKINHKNIKYFDNNREFEICGIGVKAFSIPHDANDPVGFCFYSEGKKITIATDIGHITSELTESLDGSDLLLLESNHDVGMLKVGPYPWWLKQRILGEKGHLSNEVAGEVIADMAENGTRFFFLGHLSRENNFPELAYQTVSNALTERKICIGTDITLDVARRDCASRVVCM
ncbi:MAG TPA: MBL fold metallo-hydrolase [Clostridiales bacterium]|nr:MBL fold metallo-hydrolase [Clostridiales bacterium]